MNATIASRDGLTYAQAVELKKQMDEAWAAHEKASSEPRDIAVLLETAPDGVFNRNVVTRSGGVMVADESGGRVFEYPVTLMAWGAAIPEEAFVAEEELGEPVWSVRSVRDDYDW